MMAFTREEVRAESVLATSLGSRFSVSAETSANTGVAPWYKMQLAVAQKVRGVVIASSPGPSPAAKAAPCNAAVPELKLTACRAPTQAANRSSNSPTFGPVVSQSDFRTSTTAWTSASSKLCRPYGNNFVRTGIPPWMASVSNFVGKALMQNRWCNSSSVETGLALSPSAAGDAASRVSTRIHLSSRRLHCLRSAGFGRYQFFQFAPRQPALIRVARIAEAFHQRFGVHPVFRLPPRMRRLNHVHIFGLQRLPRLVFRDQHFVQLLSRTNPDVFHLASGSNGLRQIQQPHAGDLGDKNLAAVHLLQAADHKLYPLLQRQPESRHARIGDRDLPAPPLFEKYRDHAPPAADDVPVARTAEARVFRARVSIRLDKDFFRAQLGRAVQIDGIHRLVGAERQNTAHTLINRRINYVASAHDNCLNRFERVVFAGWHLLERRRVHHHRHARERPLQALYIPHISNEITQAGMIEARRSHFMLLQLVAAENRQSLRVVVAEHDLHKFLPERSCPTRYQYRFLRPIHHSCSLRALSVSYAPRHRIANSRSGETRKNLLFRVSSCAR